jgi:hypothetical protein
MVIPKIRALPEVKTFLKKDKAMLVVARNPEQAFKYYWIKLI